MRSASEQFKDVERLEDGWSERPGMEGCSAPNDFAIEVAKFLVKLVGEVEGRTIQVCPSYDGGVGLTVREGERAIQITCHNDEQCVLSVLTDPDESAQLFALTLLEDDECSNP